MKNKKIGIIVLVIILLAGGAYAFISLGTQTPEEEVMAAERKTTSADSYSINMEMDMNVTGMEEAPDVSFLFRGDYDRLAGAFDGEGEINVLMEGLAANFGSRVILADDNLYGRVTTFPYMALPIGGEQVDMITENNILLVEDVPTKINLFLEDLFTDMERDPLTLEELLEKSEDLSRQMWREGAIVVTDVNRDDLEGEKADRYTLEIDGEKTADFVTGLIEDYEIMELFPQLTEEEKEEMLREMDRELRESYEDEEIYVWVQDGYLVRMEMMSTTEIKEEDLPQVDELNEVPEAVTVKMIVEYSNFNEEFDITAPEEHITLEELMESLQLFPLFDLNPEDVEL